MGDDGLVIGTDPRLVELANQLLVLREEAGLTPRRLASAMLTSQSTLAAATNGRRLPTWDFVERYVSACGEDPAPWRQAWEQLARELPHKESTDSGQRSVDALGPTGQRVGRRVAELRRARQLTLAELEEKLTELGRPIGLSSLSKVEQGQRRVDSDDLVALALALGVAPNSLLLPGGTASWSVELTPTKSLNTRAAWHWANGDLPAAPFQMDKTDIRYDFFISAAHADRPWAEWIASTLAHAGYRVFYDLWEIKAGDNLPRRLGAAMGGSERIIAVTSPHYPESAWASAEWQVALQAGRQLIPVRIGECTLPPPLCDLVYVDLQELDETAARKRLLDAVQMATSQSPARTRVVSAFPGRTST